MFKRTWNNSSPEKKWLAEKNIGDELSETELTKVAGGVPPRSGTPGAEI